VCSWQISAGNTRSLVFDREKITAVHAISTDLKATSFKEVKDFFEKGNITFKLSRVKGILNPSDTKLNEQFEEVLLRWALAESITEDQRPYFCLSGGTNLMVCKHG
jgi:hypothetical protein